MTDLEAEREQKQRDFDRKLLLAKSKIEIEEASVAAGGLAPGGLLLPPPWSKQARAGVRRPEGSGSHSRAEGCVAKGKSTFLPLALVSHLSIEKIGLVNAFHNFLLSNKTFCSISIYGLGKHRIEKREKQAGSGALAGGGSC